MTPLFELPKNILKENLSEYKNIVQLYSDGKLKKLDDVVVTKILTALPTATLVMKNGTSVHI